MKPRLLAQWRVPMKELEQFDSLQRDGFVIVRDVLPAKNADDLRNYVNSYLSDTISGIADGRLDPADDLFGATAPLADYGTVAHRWNLLLPMAPVVLESLEAVLSHLAPLFERACGSDAELCDLSALIVDPGSEIQQLHFDTRYSDVSTPKSDEQHWDDDEVTMHAEVRSLQAQKRLVTAFVAVQDVADNMAPTEIVPGTANATVHDEVVAATASGKEAIHSLIGRMTGDGALAAVKRCILAKGDVVLMDSRALHRGTANNSTMRRILFDFAFVGRKVVPSTYCQCIKADLIDRFTLADFTREDGYEARRAALASVPARSGGDSERACVHDQGPHVTAASVDPSDDAGSNCDDICMPSFEEVEAAPFGVPLM